MQTRFYISKGSLRGGKAVISTDEGKPLVTFKVKPLRVYQERADDHADDLVPGTISMEYNGVVCSPDVLSISNIDQPFNNAITNLLTQVDSRSIICFFFNREVFNYSRTILEGVAARERGWKIAVNNEVQELIRRWDPKLYQRFITNDQPWVYSIFMFKTKDEPLYNKAWTQTNKTLLT